MKNGLKKTAAAICTGAMALSLLSVPVLAENPEVLTEPAHHTIGVAHYTDSGKGVEALKAFLNGVGEELNLEIVYTTLSTYDEATNLTAIQNLISSGCEGILMSADMGTESIIKECEAAGVYMAGFLCDYNTSYNTAFDTVFGSENFLGTVCDGNYDQSEFGDLVAEKVIEGGYKNIGVITFPDYAYPMQAVIDQEFRTKIDEYNATAAEEDQITVADTEVLNFAPLDPTYFSSHPDLDAIFSIAAGAGNVYPVMVSSGKTDIKLYTGGFEGTDDVDNFGSNGNQCYQGILFSQPEALAYPLCLMIDKLNGFSYSDQPETAERVDCSNMFIMSDEDMAKLVEYSMYYDATIEKSMISPEEVKNLCASYNADATYAGLVDRVGHLGVEDLG